MPESKRAVQVSYSIQDEFTKEREVGAIKAFHSKYGLKEAEIVTYSDEGIIEFDGLKIKVIPLLKWLLENEKR